MLARPVTALAPLLLLAVLGGCRQNVLDAAGGPVPGADLGDRRPAAAEGTASGPGARGEPPGRVSTVADPEAPTRPISLAECVALALENGRTGEYFDRADSERRTSLTALQLQAPAANYTDSIRVFAYDPAVANADLELALSRFDVLWRTGIDWTRVNVPAGLESGFVPLVGILNGEAETANFHT
jgi:hypothetical protein